MSRRHPIMKALSVLLPAGAFGASVMLALSAHSSSPQWSQEQSSGGSVSERLRAIRAGVAEMNAQHGGPQATASNEETPAHVVPTQWANGPNWANGPGWQNGPSWGNGPGWANAGWPNGWHNWGNGWHNWPNGWHNWGMGWHNGFRWHNFWHNW